MWALEGMMDLHTIYHTFRSRISLCVYTVKHFSNEKMHLEWGRWFIYLGITWYRLFFVHSALHRRHHHWAELGWCRSLYASDIPVRNGYYTQTTLSKWTSHHLLEGNDKTWIKCTCIHTEMHKPHIRHEQECCIPRDHKKSRASKLEETLDVISFKILLLQN